MSKKSNKGEDKAAPAAVVNANAVTGLKDEVLDEIVYAYLEKKGYATVCGVDVFAGCACRDTTGIDSTGKIVIFLSLVS